MSSKCWKETYNIGLYYRHKFHSVSDDKKHSTWDDISSVYISSSTWWQLRNNQHWMILATYGFHPGSDSKKHPVIKKITHGWQKILCWIWLWTRSGTKRKLYDNLPKLGDFKVALNDHSNIDDFIWQLSSIFGLWLYLDALHTSHNSHLLL